MQKHPRRVIFSACYVEEGRWFRNQKWLDYYLPLLPTLGVEKIMLFDNASGLGNLLALGGRIYDAETGEFVIGADGNPKLEIYRWNKFLGKDGAKPDDPYYPYWWRAFLKGHEMGMRQGYDVIIQNDTDFYLLNDRISGFVRDLNSGFNTFWCPKYNFPESAFTVLCRDAFPKMLEFMTIPPAEHDWKLAELILPFTNVIKDFKGDRYGETQEPQDPTMDYYAQYQPGINLLFESRVDTNTRNDL